MADISYLFEEGTLVDFEIDELVRLVKALFADTALRTNIISKLPEGHPLQSSWVFALLHTELVLILIIVLGMDIYGH